MGGSDGAPRIPPAVRVSNLPPKRRQSQCGRCGVEGRRESVERVRLYSKAVQMCSPKWERSPSQHTHAHHRRHQASRAHTHVLGGVASSFRPHLHTVHRHVTLGLCEQARQVPASQGEGRAPLPSLRRQLEGLIRCGAPPPPPPRGTSTRRLLRRREARR